MTTHTVDTFGGSSVDLGSHTPDSGGPWTNIDADANHIKTSGSNTLNTTTTTNGDGSYAVDVGSADMYAEMTLASFTQIPTNGLGLAVRITDKNNFYGIARASTSQCSVVKRVGGTFTTFTPTLSIPNRSSGDRIRIEIIGTTLTIYNNGTAIYSTTDSSLSSSTKAGFYTHNTTAGTNILSKFEADAVGGGSTTVTLAQVSWSWTGSAANVNAKAMRTLAQAAWSWAANAPGINARSDITLAQALWAWTAFPVDAAANAAVTLAQASWNWVGSAVAVNAKAAVALAQAAWTWIGNAPTLSMVTTLRKVTWQWVARPIPTGQILIGRLKALLGVGQ